MPALTCVQIQLLLLGKLIELDLLRKCRDSVILGKLSWLISLCQPLSSCYHHSSTDHIVPDQMSNRPRSRRAACHRGAF